MSMNGSTPTHPNTTKPFLMPSSITPHERRIAMDEMKAAAWKYGSQSQIMLDGTFGICDKRLLRHKEAMSE